MKFLTIIFSLLLSSSVFANEQELTLKPKADGKPSFGIQYAYDSDMAWSFTYSTTISNEALSNLPNEIYWNVLNLKTNQILTSWTETNKSSLMVGSIGTTNKSVVSNLLPNLKTSKVVFGVKNAQNNIDVLYSLPIGPLCTNYPTHFLDLTNTGKPACTVSSYDIPDWQSECKELSDELLGYVKENLISCAIAQKKYSKEGCGVLSCP